MESVKKAVGEGSIFTLLPFAKKKVGIVTTGNEVFHGRIKDTFTPVVKGKIAEYGSEVIATELSSDDPEMEIECINRVVSYGAPVLPGAMFMLAYKGKNDETAIMGLPGCVMYEGRTIFDLILPRIFANDIVTKESMDRLGMGGFCMHCKVCNFPNCALVS